jgi:hypothetical protein
MFNFRKLRKSKVELGACMEDCFMGPSQQKSMYSGIQRKT